MKLAIQRKILERANENWPQFLKKRQERLLQMNRPGGGAEKVTEGILEDLFTMVLDWSTSDLNWQMGRCDLVLTKNGIKYLLLEAKYPNLFSSEAKVKNALQQVLRYAGEQKVRKIAVCDSYLMLIGEISEVGILEKHLKIYIDEPVFPINLWLLSEHGSYRSIPIDEQSDINVVHIDEFSLLHQKHERPSRCFAYVGDENDPKTWKLPHLLSDSSVDIQRLPKAISAVISNYRGTKVKDIPEQAIPFVLKKLADSARRIRKMPDQDPKTSETYRQLAKILDQFA